MNVDADNKYVNALKGFLSEIGFSADRVNAINITDGRIEVALVNLPHGDPALSTQSTIAINYLKGRP